MDFERRFDAILKGRKIGLNEVDVNSGDSQMMDVDDTISAEVHEGTTEVHEGTAQVNEGTAEVNEGTAEVNESTAGANLSTEPSMKKVEDEAGPSTFQDESDEFIQDDILIADTLVEITRPRRGAGITIPGNISEQERPESPTQILDPKDKGKGIMKEEPKKKKLTLQQLRAAETANDEEVARKVTAEWEEEEERKRLAGLERLQDELEDNEMIAAEVQRTERENFTEEQKAKFLVETIAAQRRFRAEQQAALRRSKPPTISQLRNQMMKYIRNVGGKAYRNLKNKSYEEIKDIYEEVKRLNDKFVAIGSTEDEQAIKEMNVKAEEPSKKRKGTIRKMKSSRIIKKRKIQKSDDELKDFLKVVDFEDDSAQDVEEEPLTFFVDMHYLDVCPNPLQFPMSLILPSLSFIPNSQSRFNILVPGIDVQRLLLVVSYFGCKERALAISFPLLRIAAYDCADQATSTSGLAFLANLSALSSFTSY
ncbi:hypothetical protein Tco_0933742 [Tanacetum coccineum]